MTDKLSQQSEFSDAHPPVAGPTEGGSVLAFFLLTFAVTWICWISIVALSVPAQTPSFIVLLFVGVFAPALVALWLTARTGGSKGVRFLLRRLVQARVAMKWYLFALGYTVTIKLLITVIYRIASGTWPRFGTTPLYLIPFAILISTPIQSGDEIGWRGFALPRLATRFGLGPASILLGVIWACWHLPLFFV